MTTEVLVNISGLDTGRFEKARQQAEERVRQSVFMPDTARYMATGIGEHPRAFIVSAWALMIIAGIAAFWVSAGKQIAATDLLLAPMVADYGNRLSPVWADAALVLTLTLGELGTILFTTSGAILGAKRYTALAFWTAAILCAGLALVANITITSLHPENIAAMPVYGWLYTVAPPVVVLFIGLYAERLLLRSLESRTKARAAYEAALVVWQQAQERPQEHPDFNRQWALAIFEQLNRVSPANRAKIAAAVEDDPAVRLTLVRREVQRHEWAAGAAFGLFEANGNPGQTRILPVDRPALTTGVPADMDGKDGQAENSVKRPNTPGDQTNGRKLDVARTWLAGHPEALTLSVSDVWTRMVADGLPVGRDTAYRALHDNRPE